MKFSLFERGGSGEYSGVGFVTISDTFVKKKDLFFGTERLLTELNKIMTIYYKTANRLPLSTVYL